MELTQVTDLLAAPWFWLAIGCVLLVIEMLMPGTMMLWFGVGALLTALHSAGHRVEVWADAAVPAAPSLRAVSRDCGYLDPRHWADLAGSLHLAQRLRQQFEAALDGPVDVWLAHGLLPFQQIALAQLLQQQAPAQVLVSLMFAPSETLGGFSGADAARLQL